MIVHTIDLDLVPGNRPQVIWLSKGDKDFTLVFQLFTRSGLLTIEDGTTVELNGTRPDGEKYTKAGTLSGTSVSISGDSTITAVEGKGLYELTLIHGDKRLSTANLIINVEQATIHTAE